MSPLIYRAHRMKVALRMLREAIAYRDLSFRELSRGEVKMSRHYRDCMSMFSKMFREDAGLIEMEKTE